jgi:hypothetical protein
MKLYQLLISLPLSLTLVSACSHQPLVQETKPIELRVANPVVPVLDQWQPLKSSIDATDDNADLWQRII